MSADPLRTPSAQELAASVAERVRRILAAAEREADTYLDDARRRADAFAEGRIRRIRDVCDRLVDAAERLAEGAEHTARLRHAIDDLVDALADAAEAVAAEASRETPHVEPAARTSRQARIEAAADAVRRAAEGG